ncbi:hypothetical protein GJ25_gp023 [Mycobacterium phage Hawkeye]|uniref:Tail terminator n=1 Tax=Mycobacterium phage Hawkeye TaxID=1458711 RepID=X2KYT5_9CAUD|nr:hypothetical protein GJ25_gp023 [Mycobacterium phage Hawkeye]AHN84034.1 hypothetical protein PBI_HAWKEYE_23 [Mycobacterium phage Hawkeye]
MSRAVILDALRADVELGAQMSPENIISNYSKEGRPSNLNPGAFAIIRWGDKTIDPAVDTGPRDMTVWVHYPEEVSTDFSRVDKILHRVKEVLLPLAEVMGADGQTLVCVDLFGESGDLTDPGFQTITRNVTFRVLSRMT